MSNNKLKILLAAPRGFCAGVDRAIEIVKKSIKETPTKNVASITIIFTFIFF